MRHVFCRKVVFLLAALLVVCGMSARKPIKTLLITGQNNHNWQVSHVVLKQILENSGRFSVDFAVSPEAGKDMSGFVLDFSPYEIIMGRLGRRRQTVVSWNMCEEVEVSWSIMPLITPS
mgnify:CR=1 FL=1